MPEPRTLVYHGEYVTSLDGRRIRYPPARVCVEPSCDTILSVYNKLEKCWLHSPVKVFHNRGLRRPKQVA
jgi:hypothetical protein